MPTNASPRLRERERLPGGQEARWIERGALDLLYSTAQAGSGARAHYGLAGWLAGWLGCLGWLAGWLAYKVPYAACRKIPCPSAAARGLWGRSQRINQNQEEVISSSLF